jgi:eukaryotic-like serine/threonine-protein kinase
MSGLEGLLAGRTLVGRYRIEEVIGRGGFAAVYRATDERLGRPVAVKVIALAAPDERTREELRARLQHEARAAASLPQHPHVVTVHDVGTDPDTGIDFLVMELLHGEDLASFLAREPRPPLQLALRILRDATEGIAVGHRAGLIHRDVKPGNIFLARAHGDEPLRVCVLDFGIARVKEEEGEITRLSAGAAPHSPAYASPEQLRGERSLTAASDVFSLGVVAYLLLTGERPFPRGRTAATPATAPLPVRERNPAVPPELEALVHRALAPEPGARFADATEVARALDAVVPGTAPDRTEPAPILAGPVPTAPVEDRTVLQPPPRRPPPPLPPRRSAAGMVAMAVAVLAGVSFVGLWAFGRAERGPGPGSPAPREAPAVGPEPAEPAPGAAAPPAAGAAPPDPGPPPGTVPGAIDRTAPPPMADPEPEPLPRPEPLPFPDPAEPAAAPPAPPEPAPQPPPRDTERVVEPPPGPPPRVLGVPAPQARGREDPPGRPPRRDTMEIRR